MFQFQIGAIRGFQHDNDTAIAARFQFQIGAIRGRLQCASHIDLQGFNSKLVRLEAGSEDFNARLEEGFNSKLVRLEGGYVEHLRRNGTVSIPNWCD